MAKKTKKEETIELLKQEDQKDFNHYFDKCRRLDADKKLLEKELLEDNELITKLYEKIDKLQGLTFGALLISSTIGFWLGVITIVSIFK